MAKKNAQIQFTQQQLEQPEDLKHKTALNRAELCRRAVDYNIIQITEHGYWPTMIPLPKVGTNEAR